MGPNKVFPASSRVHHTRQDLQSAASLAQRKMALTFKWTNFSVLFSSYEFDDISLKKLSAHLNACLSETETKHSG